MTLHLTDNARKVLEKRYLKKDEKGNPIEKPEDLFRRVAKAVASAETKYLRDGQEGLTDSEANVVISYENKFYDMMVNLEFLPNSPTLFNAGRDNGTLSGCFAFDIEDSMEDILEVNKKIGLVEKCGGGIGISLSHLRPKGFHIESTHGKSCGPIAVMKMVHATNDMITQGGKRAGAMMAILRVDHPDIEEFITCKESNDVLNGFNISVVVTDKFMEAVNSDYDHDFVGGSKDNFPQICDKCGEEHKDYWNLIWDGKVVKTVNAKELFNKIAEHAWKNGDPGLLFYDEMQKHNPTPWLGDLIVNPCGEQTLISNESCNLGSINLSKFVTNKINEISFPPQEFSVKEKEDWRNYKLNQKIDWEHLKEVTELAVRFLDDVIDINKFPVKEIEETTLRTRKIGLGVMGWADMLVKLNIPYNSDEAILLADEIMGKIDWWAEEASVDLSKKKSSYPSYKTI